MTKYIWWPRDLKPWAVFAGALLVSTFFSWDLGDSLLSLPHSCGLGLVQWGACFLLFLWGCNLAPNALDRFLVYGGSTLSVVAIGQVAAGVPRDGLIGGNPIILGGLLVVAFPTAWRVNRWLAALFFVAVVAARSRSSAIAMAVMAMYLWRSRCD